MTNNELADIVMFRAFDLALSLLSETELRALMKANGFDFPGAKREGMRSKLLVAKFGPELTARMLYPPRTVAEKIQPEIHYLDKYDGWIDDIRARGLCGATLEKKPGSAPFIFTNIESAVTCPECARLISLDYSDRT